MEISEWEIQYKKERPRYEQFTRELNELLTKLLHRAKIRAVIEYRTKEEPSFASKITRLGKNYVDPLKDITDLSGLRIIVDTLHDVERVSEIIKGEFTIDEERSIDKSEQLDPDRFGYLSRHFIVTVQEARKNLSEWADFTDMFAEIQVRTALQHTWSVVQHPLDYKSDIDIPKSLKRRIYRLSALFELADQELDVLITEAEKLRTTYAEQVRTSEANIELNLESLRAFIEESPEVARWASFTESLGAISVIPSSYAERDVLMPKECGIETVAAYEKLLQNSHSWGEEFMRQALSTFRKEPKQTVTISKNVITMFLLIGNYPDIFTEEKITKYRVGNAGPINNLAKKINPRFRAS